jgi:hypothetical protein
MSVNNDDGLRRAATLGLVFSWGAMLLALIGAALTFIGSFDTSFGNARILVRYSDANWPDYALRLGAISYLAFASAMWRLVQFLRLSRMGQVFVAQATAHLRAFGRRLLAAAAIGTLLPLAAIGTHAFLAPAAAGPMPIIRVPLSASLFILAISTLVMMICRVIDEGRRFRDDLNEIV